MFIFSQAFSRSLYSSSKVDVFPSISFRSNFENHTTLDNFTISQSLQHYLSKYSFFRGDNGRPHRKRKAVEWIEINAKGNTWNVGPLQEWEADQPSGSSPEEMYFVFICGGGGAEVNRSSCTCIELSGGLTYIRKNGHSECTHTRWSIPAGMGQDERSFSRRWRMGISSELIRSHCDVWIGEQVIPARKVTLE